MFGDPYSPQTIRWDLKKLINRKEMSLPSFCTWSRIVILSSSREKLTKRSFQRCQTPNIDIFKIKECSKYFFLKICPKNIIQKIYISLKKNDFFLKKSWKQILKKKCKTNYKTFFLTLKNWKKMKKKLKKSKKKWKEMKIKKKHIKCWKNIFFCIMKKWDKI